MATFSQAGSTPLRAASQAQRRGHASAGRARTSVQPSALTGMLLAASMAVLLFLADYCVNTWTDGRLLAPWIALWTLVFVGLAILALPLRRAAATLASVIARTNTTP